MALAERGLLMTETGAEFDHQPQASQVPSQGEQTPAIQQPKESRFRQALKFAGRAIGIGVVAATPASNALHAPQTPEPTKSPSGHEQVGESLGTKPLEQVVEKVLNATAEKAGAQPNFRVFVSSIPNRTSLSPESTPIPTETLEQRHVRGIEVPGTRLEKTINGKKIAFSVWRDPDVTDYSVNVVGDDATKNATITMLAQDGYGDFDETGKTTFDEINLWLWPDRDTLTSKGVFATSFTYKSNLIGYFAVRDIVVNGVKKREVFFAPPSPTSENPDPMQHTTNYDDGLDGGLARYTSCASIWGVTCEDSSVVRTQEQLDRMRQELNLLISLVQAQF